MTFFVDKNNFTHRGTFYLIPVYLNLNEDTPVISGTNILFDKLLLFMSYFHNIVIERVTQGLAQWFNEDYEPSFPFWITEEFVREDKEMHD